MKKYKRKKNNRLPPFVALTWDTLNSQAYKALTPSASKALPYFLGKVKLTYNDPDRYENAFTFSYTEGRRFGFASSTFHSVICELVEKGFIDPVDKGGLRSDGKSFNYFKLSKRWGKYGKEDFIKKEWSTFLPKLRIKPTQKSEINSFKKGNGMSPVEEIISINEPVGAF
ncbi:MAG: hypothetical protein RDU01_04110 [Thermodesulfovibrionales bacterium]|nr:hypothetical protein [Thermodesulfovibrionales bacterium]